TVIPALGIAHRENDLGIGILLEQLPVERTARPVDGRPISIEERIPVDGLATRRRIPFPRVIHPRKHFDHVVALAESKCLERVLERERPRPAEAGSDDLDRHLISPGCGPSRPAGTIPCGRITLSKSRFPCHAQTIRRPPRPEDASAVWLPGGSSRIAPP